MPRDFIGFIHVISAILALILGLVIFLGVKGTARHKFLGWGYGIAIMVLNLSALSIYRVNAHFNLFHAGAIFSLITTVGGLTVIRSGKPDRILIHYKLMCGSYLGLLAAFFAEILTRTIIPRLPGQGVSSTAFWTLVIFISLSSTLLGMWIIKKSAPTR